jgi:hypothetical protein
VSDHHTPSIASLRFKHVTAIDRHWIAIAVVFKRGRGRAHPLGSRVEVEMPRWDAPQKRYFIADVGIVRKEMAAVFGAQGAVSLSGNAVEPGSKNVLVAGKRRFHHLIRARLFRLEADVARSVNVNLNVGRPVVPLQLNASLNSGHDEGSGRVGTEKLRE